jgi:hypothetical protein
VELGFERLTLARWCSMFISRELTDLRSLLRNGDWLRWKPNIRGIRAIARCLSPFLNRRSALHGDSEAPPARDEAGGCKHQQHSTTDGDQLRINDWLGQHRIKRFE